MSSRDIILNKIKSAEKDENTSSDIFDLDEKINKGIASVTPQDVNGLWTQFKKELETIAGEFHSVKTLDEAVEIISSFLADNKFNKIGISKESICRTLAEKVKNHLKEIKTISAESLNYPERKNELASTEISIVHPSFAVADIGSLVFIYNETGTSLPHFLCDNTFVIINKAQIVANQFELFNKIDIEKTKNMVFITGPSRTADIEKVLVLGAHGPRKLVVFLLDA
jgi:L-lactate dehydrogenase complex protein LldG